MSRLLTSIGRFAGLRGALSRARDGSVSIIFGLSLIPILGLIGLGVDYGVIITTKTKLNSSADAAALAGVVTAKAYIAANPNDPNLNQDAIAAGEQQALNSFNVNTGKVALATVSLTTNSVTRDHQTLNATITYTATVNNIFGKLFRAPPTTISNTVQASVDLPSYLDFYLMVDVSGSMGLPTSSTDMLKLQGQNNDMAWDYPYGCVFACHYPGNNGWTLAAGKIQLRSDSVNKAVCWLLQRAAAPLIPNQYRVGIYPFINQLTTMAPLTSNIATLTTAAQCGQTWPMAFTNLLDTGATQFYTNKDPSTGTGAGGTHFDTAMPQMKASVVSYGNGASISTPKPFIFLITDGMQNNQHYYSTVQGGKYYYAGNPSQFKGYANANFDGSQSSPIDPATCAALKTAGATISILYIPYIQIATTDNGGIIATENKRVNGFSPTLSTPLQSCASPGLLFTATTDDDITKALNAMFDSALKVARITK